ncbi:MAG TPA: rRNA maturation RNase YbeY [Caulobacterales bacterium]|nr:rRNA maturation RNase YbeY [Caulobacterales bacterium]
MAELEVDIVGGSEIWKGLEGQLAKALAAAAMYERIAGTVSLLLGDDAAITALNREFRGKDEPTNVLSFPPAPAAEGFLGDIALAAETIAAEAQFQGKSFSAHASHLAVHGFLHLVGYDHVNDADAEVMEARETAILRSIGIDDPYS